MAERTDECLDLNTLVEYSCSADSGIVAEKVACPEGTLCQEGSCRGCVDSDGDSVAAAGFVAFDFKGKPVHFYDFCLSDTTVMEAVCPSANIIIKDLEAFRRKGAYVAYECPGKTICSAGRCVSRSTRTNMSISTSTGTSISASARPNTSTR